MFSQFRHAVEQLAQQVPVPGQHDDSNGTGERRGSLDMRRSLSQQSGDSPKSSPNMGNGRGNGGSAGAGSTRGLSLEERLKRAAAAKATAASPDASGGSSPDSGRKGRDSAASSPSIKSQQRRTMSPASTPLPDSPALMARRDSFVRTNSSLGKSESTIPDLELDGTKEENDEGKDAPSEEETPSTESGKEQEKAVEPAATKEVEGVDEDAKDPQQAEIVKHISGVVSSIEPQNQPSIEEPIAESPLPVVDPPSEPSSSFASPTPEESPKPEVSDTAKEATELASPASNQAADTEEKSELPASDSPEPDSKPQPTIAAVQNHSEDDSKNLESPARVEIEELQQRLKQVEQRFTDVSTSFKRLQAEKVAADAVLRDLTPIDTIQDSPGLKDYLSNLNSKQEIFQNEIKLLNGKLSGYEERLEELRDVHRLETKSQTDQMDKLATQLQETEALFQASERAITEAEGRLASDQTDAKALQTEIERYKTLAKEEEEKRVKAVSLLKTVRQKLVKAEKEKEDALREAAASKDRDRGEKETDRLEKLKLQQELEIVQIEREKMAAAQKAQFERELVLQKERYEKEMAAVKGQLELEIITLKSSHSKELSAKSSQISTLENSLNSVTRDKNAFFEQLQIKQAETESAQSHLESLQHQNTELEFQLREASERLAFIKEEYADYQREQEVKAREPVTSASDIAHMISATEAKYEVKLAESRRSVAVLEKERSESEANWSRKLKEKVKELEDLKRLLGSAARSREEDISAVEALKSDLGRAREEVRILKEQLLDVPVLQEAIQDLKNGAKELEEELRQKTSALEHLAEEHKSREAQLKQANKTLREELRKVQSSAALLERQRNPGVGYWNRVGDAGGEAQSPTASTTSVASGGATSPRPASPAPSASSGATANRAEEEVNLEYLRNVILQFLEHKEMRPSLVKVISIILHFTPQETRRLMAKV